MVFAGHLGAARKHDVIACVRHPRGPWTIDTADGSFSALVKCTTDPDRVEPADWVLLCTKAHATGLEPWLERLCSRTTRVAVLQNGVDLVARIAPLCVAGRVMPTVVYANAKRLAEDRIRHMSPGRDLAVADDDDGRALAALFDGSAIKVTLETDFTTASWHKFLINIVSNPLTAIMGRGIGVMRQPDMEALAIAMMREAAAVGRKFGAKFEEDAPEKILRWMSNYPPDTGTSMLEDRQAGRPLEHEALTGTLVRLGRESGVPTPVNEVILALLRGI